MKISGYVEGLIKRRAMLARQLQTACKNLDFYLDRNGIETDSGDSHGGMEIYTNPDESAERIREAIRSKVKSGR